MESSMPDNEPTWYTERHAIGVGPTATDAIVCAVTTLSERSR